MNPEAFTNQPGQRLDIPDPAVSLQGTTMGGSIYKIFGTTLPVVVLTMRPQVLFYSETGALSWMSDGVRMNTNTGGGLSGIFKRAISGESLFVVDYQADRDGTLAAFSSDFPGKIIPINLGAGQSILAQKGAFLTAEKSVQMSVALTRKLGAGLFGGEGFVLQQFIGPGTMFAAFDGEIVEYTLGAGEKMKVDTGHVAMFEYGVQYDIEVVKGFTNILFGGEGLFFATLTGPGRIWLQTMPMVKLAGAIAAYLPKSESPNKPASGGNIVGGILDTLTR